MTIIAIAHRLSTVLQYDKIVVMDKGSVAEIGPPEQLRRNPESLLNQLIEGM